MPTQQVIRRANALAGEFLSDLGIAERDISTAKNRRLAGNW